MTWYDNKKAYNKDWTNNNTKALSIRLNKNDDTWEKIEALKANGIKMNALFKSAVDEEFKKMSKK